jgi:acetyltransferase
VITRCAESVILDERIESPVCGAPIVQIRSIEVTDSAPIREFVQSLSFETRYLRFMSAVKELSAPMVDRLTRVDHQRDAALIAVVNTDGADRVVGVARYVANADGESCEFAIVVADEWQRRALGSRLLALLVNRAATRGLKRIRGDMLAINAPMTAFVKAHGFTVSRSHEDPTLRHAELPLDCERA